MNIFKVSQDTFDFYNVMPETKQKSLEEFPEYKSLEDRSQKMFQELLDGISGRAEVMRILKMYNIKWTQTTDGIIIYLGSYSYKIDNFERPILQRIEEKNELV